MFELVATVNDVNQGNEKQMCLMPDELSNNCFDSVGAPLPVSYLKCDA
jgi:hypothetical protein